MKQKQQIKNDYNNKIVNKLRKSQTKKEEVP